MSELLKEGDVILIGEGHKVYMNLPNHFIYANTVGEFEKCSQTEVSIGAHRGGLDTSVFAGRYIVTSTAMTGGGTGHGPGDVYPDGHQVTCRHADHPLLRLRFYQTGSFTAMIPEIEAIGRATAEWSVNEPVTAVGASITADSAEEGP